jgi:type IV pilus assembly protein PilC
MPKFCYSAIDGEGRPTSGELEAASWDDASRSLEQRGLRVESLRLVEQTGDDRVQLGKRDFEVITGQVVDLARVQLPLASGLEILSQELPRGRLKRGMRSIAKKISTGMSLEDAFAKHGAPNELRALIRSGLRTGRVSDVLSQYIAHLRTHATARLQLAMTFAYPLLMLLMAAGIVLFLLVMIVPEFKKIFSDFDTELPALTAFVVWITDTVNGIIFSRFMIYIGWPLIVLVMLFGFLWVSILRVGSGRGAFPSLIRKIPLAGPIVHWASMSRFCHMLAVLIENKVPLPEALVLAGDGVEDAAIRADSRELALRISTGDLLGLTRGSLSGFPGSFIQTLMQYKQTQALPEALHAIADMFEGRTRLQSNFVAAICGPIFMIMAAVTIAIVVLAMFLPLIQLLNDLS